MSTIMVVARGQLKFCPSCADVYGQVGRLTKRCDCAASSATPNNLGGSDFAIPFEVCYYCQAEIVSSGSRWSTFYCDVCHPIVLRMNDELDALGFVSLPIGRHSLMHTRWTHARPFTTTERVRGWRTARLRSAWQDRSAQADSTDWIDFSQRLREIRDRAHFASLQILISDLQSVPADWLMDDLREANRQFAASRSGVKKGKLE